MKRISLPLLIASFLLLAGGPEISAQEQNVSWDRLSKAERQILQPYAGRWKDFPASKQKRLQKGARRWVNLPQKERGIVKTRFQRWKKFTPKQRERIRSKFQHFKRLPRKKQDRIRRAQQWFRNLPKERKEKLRQRWKNIPGKKRSDWRKKTMDGLNKDRFNRNINRFRPRARQHQSNHQPRRDR